MNLIMELGFACDVEIYRLGFEVVLNASDFRFVDFDQPRVQLLKEVVYLACLPVEVDNRVAAAVASADDVFDDLLNRGNVERNLRGSVSHLRK